MKHETGTISLDSYSPEAAMQAIGEPDPQKLGAIRTLIEGIFTGVRDNSAYGEDEEQLDEDSANLAAAVSGFSLVDSQLISERAPEVLTNWLSVARERRERSEPPDESFLTQLAVLSLLELAKPEVRAKYDLAILFERIDQEEGQATTPKQRQLLAEMLVHKKKLTYKEDWRKGGFCRAVKTFSKDLTTLEASLWGDGEGRHYLGEIENVFALWRERLPTKAASELQQEMSNLVETSYDQYATRFLDQTSQTLSSGRNGSALFRTVTDFTLRTLDAAALIGNGDERKRLGKRVDQVIASLAGHKKGLYAAALLVGWHDGARELPPGEDGTPQVVRQEVAVGKDRYLYLHDVVKYVDREVIDAVGKVLMAAKNRSYLDQLVEFAENGRTLRDWPTWILSRVADCFADSGYVAKLESGQYRLKTKKGKYPLNLDYDSLRSVMLAHTYMYFGERQKPELTSYEDVVRLRNENRELIKLPSLELMTPNTKIETFGKLEHGFEDMDAAFVARRLTELEKLAPAERPSVVVIDDIVFGTFEVTKKNKRLTLDKKMLSLDTQFAAAGLLIDRLLGMGIKVVVLQGSDAWDISDDHAVLSVQRWEDMARPIVPHDKRYLNYHDVDRIKQTRAYNENLDFQWEVVYPYCLRAKRSLLTADEVSEQTKGRLRIEEALLLRDAYERTINGEEIPAEYLEVLNMDCVPFRGREFDDGLYIVDDATVTLKPTDGSRSMTVDLWDKFAFSPQPLYASPLNALKTVVGNQAAEGEATYDLVMTMNQQWATGVAGPGDSLIVSAPGVHTYTHDKKGSHRNAAGNSTLRQLMRGTPPVAATAAYERRPGHFVTELVTDEILDKSYATEPTAIALIQDTQIGSDTANLDLIPPWIDYIMTEVAPQYTTYVGINGDITHGLNFPGSAIVNGPSLLNNTRKQNQLGHDLMSESMQHYRSEELERVKKWMNLPGNHQWNSQTKNTGELYVQWIEGFLRETYLRAYGPLISNEELARRIKTYDTMRTTEGDFMFDAWTAVEPIGAFGVGMQHLILDKMAKSGCEIPIFQFKNFIDGTADLQSKQDIWLYGHWHHLMHMLLGNKVAVVGPALAGQSWYEWKLGYRPQRGGLVVTFGGGKPIKIDFVTAAAIYNHTIKDGQFSKQALADQGFLTDPGFVPGRDGFSTRTGLHDARQKKVWSMIEKINYEASSTIVTKGEDWRVVR